MSKTRATFTATSGYLSLEGFSVFISIVHFLASSEFSSGSPTCLKSGEGSRGLKLTNTKVLLIFRYK